MVLPGLPDWQFIGLHENISLFFLSLVAYSRKTSSFLIMFKVCQEKEIQQNSVRKNYILCFYKIFD